LAIIAQPLADQEGELRIRGGIIALLVIQAPQFTAQINAGRILLERLLQLPDGIAALGLPRRAAARALARPNYSQDGPLVFMSRRQIFAGFSRIGGCQRQAAQRLFIDQLARVFAQQDDKQVFVFGTIGGAIGAIEIMLRLMRFAVVNVNPAHSIEGIDMRRLLQQRAVQVNLRPDFIASLMRFRAQLRVILRRIASCRICRAVDARPGGRRAGDVFVDVFNQQRDDGVIRVLQLSAAVVRQGAREIAHIMQLHGAGVIGKAEIAIRLRLRERQGAENEGEKQCKKQKTSKHDRLSFARFQYIYVTSFDSFAASYSPQRERKSSVSGGRGLAAPSTSPYPLCMPWAQAYHIMVAMRPGYCRLR